MLRARLTILAWLLCSLALGARAFAGNDTSGESKFAVGIGFKVSTLGLGGDVAFPVTERTNLRFGFNAFNYNHTFDKDGVKYDGTLALRSVQALFDIFPFSGGFHLSPGVMLYNGNKLTADSSVTSGQTFDLGNVTYRSNPANPLKGTGDMKLNKAAPMFMLGFGNMVPRSGRHVTVSFEAGVVYQGSPDVRLNFTGSACSISGANCVNAATDPTFLSHVAAEQKKLTDDATAFKWYPVVSVGLGYRFGGGNK